MGCFYFYYTNYKIHITRIKYSVFNIGVTCLTPGRKILSGNYLFLKFIQFSNFSQGLQLLL